MSHDRRCVLIALLAALACARDPAMVASRARTTEATAPAALPSDPSLVFAEAVALVEAGRGGEARSFFLRLLETYPALEDYHLAYLAAIEELSGRLVEAAAYDDRLFATHGESVWVPEALARRARVAAASDDTRAAEFAARALAHPGADAATRAAAHLVEADLRAARDARGAYALYQQVRKSPNGAIGEIMEHARRQSTALEITHPELLRDPDLLLGEGTALVAEGRLDEAVTRLEAAALAGPQATRAAALRLLGRAHKMQGRIDDAIAAYRAAMEADPAGEGTAQLELATLLWNRDRDDEAATLFAALLRDAPRHPKRDQARYALGRIAERRGDRAEALSHYGALAAGASADELPREARWRLAWVHYEAGEMERAALSFAALEKHEADRAAGGYWRGRIEERLHGREAAAPAYRRLLAEAPESYYADLAEQRLGESAAPPPAPMPLTGEPPATLTTHGYHWSRHRELHALSLDRAAARELDAIARALERTGTVEPFLMEVYRQVEAHKRALDQARRFVQRGREPDATLSAYLYPHAFWSEISAAAESERLDPHLVVSLIRQESLFDARARSAAAAHGLMQLLTPTATRVAGRAVALTELHDPGTNIQLGTRHLRALLDRYQGDLPRALAAYNAGEDAVAKWAVRTPGAEADAFVEGISFRETRTYVKSVLGNYRRYRRLYGAPGQVRALANAPLIH